MKDYYEILGVDEKANADEIKKAYRKLSKKNHPDLNPNDKEAEERFKLVNEANIILSDEQKRKEYDLKRQYGDQGAQQFGGFDPFGGMVNDFFRRGQRQREESKIVIPLTLLEVLHGSPKRIVFDKKNICQVCKGTGKEKVDMCPTCHGAGMVSHREQRGNMYFETAGPCYHCKGSGHITSGPTCKECAGVGYKIEHQDFTVDVPIGIPYGVPVRLDGKGNNNGALNVIFAPDSSDTLERVGDDIAGFLELSYPELILGSEKVVNTVDGAVKVKTNKFSNPEDKIRLRGQGLPNYHHRERGDLFLVLRMKEITELTPEEETILQSLLDTKNFKT